MQQQTIDFDAAPRARLTDPVTSHLAAEDVVLGGLAGQQAREVFETLSLMPGATSAEIGVAMGWEGARWAAARRLPELERSGQVRRGEPRVCGNSHRPATTWWPIKSH